MESIHQPHGRGGMLRSATYAALTRLFFFSLRPHVKLRPAFPIDPLREPSAMNLRPLFRLLPFVAVLSLTGCIQDTASYIFPEKDHAITLVRNQTWFWQDTVDIDVIALRLPVCDGAMHVVDVPRESKLTIYKAPDEYPEPIFILKIGKQLYAISTQSCQVQKFKETPADLGEKLGQFYEKDGKFQFVADKPRSAAAKEE
jgi:hypothetical protein